MLSSSLGVPLVNAASITSADITGRGGGLGKSVGEATGGAIARKHDEMIQRNAVVGDEGSLAQAAPKEAKAFGLVLTDRRLAMYELRLDQLEAVVWEVSRERLLGIRKLAPYDGDAAAAHLLRRRLHGRGVRTARQGDGPSA